MEFYKSIWTFSLPSLAGCRVVAYSYYFICLRRYGVWKREENENCTKILRKSVPRKAIFTLLNENCIPRESTFQIKFIYMQNTDDVFGCFVKTPHRSTGGEKKQQKRELNLAKAFRSDNLLSFYQSIAELRHEHYIYRFNVYMQKKETTYREPGKLACFPKV